MTIRRTVRSKTSIRTCNRPPRPQSVTCTSFGIPLNVHDWMLAHPEIMKAVDGLAKSLFIAKECSMQGWICLDSCGQLLPRGSASANHILAGCDSSDCSAEAHSG